MNLQKLVCLVWGFNKKCKAWQYINSKVSYCCPACWGNQVCFYQYLFIHSLVNVSICIHFLYSVNTIPFDIVIKKNYCTVFLFCCPAIFFNTDAGGGDH